MCWGWIPTAAWRSPPTPGRWPRSSTAACSGFSSRANTPPFSPLRRSSAAPGRRAISARPTRWRSWGGGADCCRSAARARSRATAWTASSWTICIRMRWRPIRRSCARTAGSGIRRWSAHGCTTPRANWSFSRAGTRRTSSANCWPANRSRSCASGGSSTRFRPAAGCT